jgi:NAD(P)H dehydrogenase (quinone)
VSLGERPGNMSSTGSEEDVNRLGSFLGLMTQSDADAGPEVAPPDGDRRDAHRFGCRIARSAIRWGAAQSPVDDGPAPGGSADGVPGAAATTASG